MVNCQNKIVYIIKTTNDKIIYLDSQKVEGKIFTIVNNRIYILDMVTSTLNKVEIDRNSNKTIQVYKFPEGSLDSMSKFRPIHIYVSNDKLMIKLMINEAEVSINEPCHNYRYMLFDLHDLSNAYEIAYKYTSMYMTYIVNNMATYEYNICIEHNLNIDYLNTKYCLRRNLVLIDPGDLRIISNSFPLNNNDSVTICSFERKSDSEVNVLLRKHNEYICCSYNFRTGYIDYKDTFESYKYSHLEESSSLLLDRSHLKELNRFVIVLDPFTKKSYKINFPFLHCSAIWQVNYE